MATTVKVKVPQFDSVKKPYSRYKSEIDFWKVCSKLEAKEQGVILAYELPEDDPSGIRDKLFNELTIEKLNCDDGLKNFTDYMDKLFLKDNNTQKYEDYVKFDNYRRSSDQKIQDFINEFDKLYNICARNTSLQLSETIRAFKLLDAANLNKQDRMFVLTGVDYSQENTLYTQMKDALKKFTGEQFCASKGNSSTSAGMLSNIDIKVEPSFPVSQFDESPQDVEKVLAALGFHRRGRGFKGGRGSFRGSRRGKVHRGIKHTVKMQKPINPKGENGELLKCVSCGSFRHMLDVCPYSYENMEKTAAESEKDGELEKVVLFTGYGEKHAEEVSLLSREATNKGVLDSGCGSNVAGDDWIKNYLDTLNDIQRQLVSWKKGKKWFKFGSGDPLPSIGVVEFPCQLGGTDIQMQTDVVETDIPLLISRKAMKNAGTLLDLANDKARFFGKWTMLDLTSSGHYVVDLCRNAMSTNDVVNVLAVVDDTKDAKQRLLKLHRRLGHPHVKRFVSFIKDAGKWEESYNDFIDDIYKKCKTCKVFAKTPPRPVCALRPASEFGEVLTMDLKEYKIPPNINFILHMVDAFTRFSVSTFLTRKLPEKVIEKVLSRWISVFGVPKKIWTDLGGEFNASEVKEMGDAFGVELGSGAGMAPWMNGICERNHQITDICLEKILFDNPKLNPEVALAWASNAKNTLKMNNGFSSHQLVFGKNPQLPSAQTDKLPALEGVTTSETVGEHITAMYSARRAFIESESSERMRRAMRHRIRKIEKEYAIGDKVYFKRDGQGHRWSGPAVVIGRQGSMYVIKHQVSILREASCRLQPIEEEGQMEELEKIEIEETEHTASTVMPTANTEGQRSKVSLRIPIGERNQSNEVQVEEREEEERREVENEEEKDGEREMIQKDVPKKDDIIRYKATENEEWKEAVVLSRAGKQSSKSKTSNKFCVNIQPSEGGEADCLNLRNVVEWKNVTTERLEEVNLVLVPQKKHQEKICVEAKVKELANFKEFDVYEEVKDVGQMRISSTWVLSEKKTGDAVGVKARLVARGYEETLEVPSDSPTCGKDSFRIFLCIAAAWSWTVESTDIRSAFLQGLPLVRDVFVEPPVEAKKAGYIWRLKKCMYGLNDAPRSWYLHVAAVLKKLGCIQGKLDLCVFIYKVDDVLCGVVIAHVDDFMHIGNKVFYDNVVLKLRATFKVGATATSNFAYLGLEVKQEKNAIYLAQKEYVDTLALVSVTSSRKLMKHDTLKREEQQQYRRVVGQVNWAARQTRPDLVFEVMELSMRFNNGTVQDLLRANKAVKKLQYSEVALVFPNLGAYEDWYLVAMSDAAFSNLIDGVSSAAGYVIFLVNNHEQCAVISWRANKIKRVVRSTLAAESLGLEEAIEHAIFLRELVKEMLGVTKPMPIEVWTDNNDAYSAVHASTQIEDRRLRIEIASIKENIAKEGVVVRWCRGKEMLADCLTKRGASSDKLMNVIVAGTIANNFDDGRRTGEAFQ